MGDAGPSSRGRRYEDVAAAFCAWRGLTVLERNVVAGGVELDLVAVDGTGTYVFVEVRARARSDLGRPEETIDGRKRARLRRGAAAYLGGRSLLGEVAVRFDVIALEGPPPEGGGLRARFSPDPREPTGYVAEAGKQRLALRWFPSAFE